MHESTDDTDSGAAASGAAAIGDMSCDVSAATLNLATANAGAQSSLPGRAACAGAPGADVNKAGCTCV